MDKKSNNPINQRENKSSLQLYDWILLIWNLLPPYNPRRINREKKEEKLRRRDWGRIIIQHLSNLKQRQFLLNVLAPAIFSRTNRAYVAFNRWYRLNFCFCF